MQSKTTFKDIGNYIVHTDGRVWSKYKEDWMTPKLSKKGYHQYHLSLDGKRTYTYAHRLIAETFIPNPDNLPEVDHISGVKTQNNLENLRWCTGKDNIQAYRDTLNKSQGNTQNAR
jgi:hypothetical protein